MAAGTEAMLERSQLACAAAIDAGLPGMFRVTRSGALTAVLTTAPGLEFLNAVHGIDERSIAGLPRLLAEYVDAGAPSPSAVGGPVTPALRDGLEDLGYRLTAPAPLALADLRALELRSSPWRPGMQVTSVSSSTAELFKDILLRAYGAGPSVSSFLAAEHASPRVRGYLAWHDGEPLAAAAMSLHGTVAVLGGAATLPGRRGSGAQMSLLLHRLHVAAASGAELAAATAAPGSPSARNLARAGFAVVDRHRWRRAS